MKIDKSKISDTQFLFSVACFLQSSSLLASFMIPIAMHQTWLATIFGIIACLPLVWLYRTIMVSYPDKNLIQLLETAFGTVGGKILGFLYAWYFMTLNALSLLDMGNFVKLTVMINTPNIVLVITLILVSSWAVRNGLGVVTRYSLLFSFFSLVVAIGSFVLLLKQIDWSNLLPVFQLPLKTYVQGTHIISTMPIGELVTILMITPNLKLSKRNVTRYFFIAYAIGMLVILMSMIRDIGILGNTLQLFNLPSLVVLRIVTIGEALSRIEVLFAIVLVILFFFKITFQQYVSVISVAQVFKIKDYHNLVLAMGALLVFYGMTLYPNAVIHSFSALETIPFIWTVFQLIIPLATLIVLKIRKVPAKKEA